MNTGSASYNSGKGLERSLIGEAMYDRALRIRRIVDKGDPERMKYRLIQAKDVEDSVKVTVSKVLVTYYPMGNM
ncbi:hypothetical protein ACQ4M3_11605 [Leptolyngbya sp. AN03gr2]|uniref:hypothetical protein n=1 Tax=Leptolyngbya sp. AN10 TaxID=3423365 RepID=UPI003D311D2A